jgi:hypothetical protein
VLSPDGKQVAFRARNDIYGGSTGGTTRTISRRANTPAAPANSQLGRQDRHSRRTVANSASPRTSAQLSHPRPRVVPTATDGHAGSFALAAGRIGIADKVTFVARFANLIVVVISIFPNVPVK